MENVLFIRNLNIMIYRHSGTSKKEKSELGIKHTPKLPSTMKDFSFYFICVCVCLCAHSSFHFIDFAYRDYVE